MDMDGTLDFDWIRLIEFELGGIIKDMYEFNTG